MTSPSDTTAYDAMFAALCVELGYCLHDKGQRRVIAALPSGLDAAVKAVLEASGADVVNTSGSLRREIRDCLKAHLPA
jgi:cysteine synthase